MWIQLKIEVEETLDCLQTGFEESNFLKVALFLVRIGNTCRLFVTGSACQELFLSSDCIRI